MRNEIDLPSDHRPFTDKYFIRSKEILEKDGFNPNVKYQIFVRKGPGRVGGLSKAAQIVAKYADDVDKVSVYSLMDGDRYAPSETLMTIEGPIQSLIELETMYLGVISAGTTGGAVNLPDVRETARKAVEASKGRPVFYFGARHWSWHMDPSISRAAYDGGMSGCSTDAGAGTFGQKGIGTIPHALVLMYGSTVAAAKAFDRHIDRSVPRIILADTYNKEIDDSLASARALGDRFSGVRLDTCGENVGQGGTNSDGRKYHTGNGVTVELARNVRTALNESGYGSAQIVLSSGFGIAEKIRAFTKAEKKTHCKLFDSLGVGGIYDARFATSDIIERDGKLCHKVGRPPRPNDRLKEVDLNQFLRC